MASRLIWATVSSGRRPPAASAVSSSGRRTPSTKSRARCWRASCVSERSGAAAGVVVVVMWLLGLDEVERAQPARVVVGEVGSELGAIRQPEEQVVVVGDDPGRP